MESDGRRAIKKESIGQAHYYGSVEGNTVMIPEEIPEEMPVRRRPESEESEQKLNEKRRQTEVVRERRVSEFSLRYTLFLGFSVAVLIGACLIMLMAQSELTSARKNAASLESTLAAVEEENRVLEEGLNATVDLEMIYNTATEEYGMVYAGEDQVIYYNSSNNDYVRQYGEIPD